MQWIPFSSGQVHAILKGTGTTKYLAGFNPISNAQSYYDQIIAPEIENAEFYAVRPDLGYIFYTAGGKVYQYGKSLKTTKLMLDLGTKRISYFGFYDFKNTSKYTGSNKLMVGSYDPSLPTETSGSLAIYTIPPVNGYLVLDKSFNGFGRIKNSSWRVCI